MSSFVAFWSEFTGLLPNDLSAPLILALALLFDAAIGDPRWFYKFIPHPVVLIGKPIGFLDRRLNRPERGERDRLIRGGITVLIIVGTAIFIGVALHSWLDAKSWGWAVEAMILGVFLAMRSLHDHVRRVGKALRAEGLDGGRREIAHLVSRDPRSLDRHGVARSAIESLAENFSDGVVAPILFYFLFGLPGLLAYKAINTLDSMIGYKTDKHRSFGFVAAKLDDVANWLPARLSGGLICLAACFTPTAYPSKGVRIMLSDAPKHKSPNAGWPEAALAGALGIALGGPRTYPGGEVVGVWIGEGRGNEGRARLEPRDIDRARGLYLIANGLTWFTALTVGLLMLV